MNPIYKVGRDNESQDHQDVNLDLSSVRELNEFMSEFIREPSLLQETHRGEIGKIMVCTMASIIVLLPLIGGLIAAFGSAAQAEAFVTTVVTLLEAVARFSAVIVWPVMLFYFVRYIRK